MIGAVVLSLVVLYIPTATSATYSYALSNQQYLTIQQYVRAHHDIPMEMASQFQVYWECTLQHDAARLHSLLENTLQQSGSLDSFFMSLNFLVYLHDYQLTDVHMKAFIENVIQQTIFQHVVHSNSSFTRSMPFNLIKFLFTRGMSTSTQVIGSHNQVHHEITQQVQPVPHEDINYMQITETPHQHVSYSPTQGVSHQQVFYRPTQMVSQQEIVYPPSQGMSHHQIIYQPTQSVSHQQMIFPPSQGVPRQEIIYPPSQGLHHQQIIYPPTQRVPQQQMIFSPTQKVAQQQMVFPQTHGMQHQQIIYPPAQKVPHQQMIFPPSQGVPRQEIIYPPSQGLHHQQIIYPPTQRVPQQQMIFLPTQKVPQQQMVFPQTHGMQHQQIIYPPAQKVPHQQMIFPPSQGLSHQEIIYPPTQKVSHQEIIFPPTQGVSHQQMNLQSTQGGSHQHNIYPPTQKVAHQQMIFHPTQRVPQQQLIFPQTHGMHHQQIIYPPAQRVPQQHMIFPQIQRVPQQQMISSQTHGMHHQQINNSQTQDVPHPQIIYPPTQRVPQKQMISSQTHGMHHQQISYPPTRGVPHQQIIHSPAQRLPQQQVIFPQTHGMHHQQISYSPTQSVPHQQIIYPPTQRVPQQQMIFPQIQRVPQQQMVFPQTHGMHHQQIIYPPAQRVPQQQMIFPQIQRVPQQQMVFPQTHGMHHQQISYPPIQRVPHQHIISQRVPHQEIIYPSTEMVRPHQTTYQTVERHLSQKEIALLIQAIPKPFDEETHYYYNILIQQLQNIPSVITNQIQFSGDGRLTLMHLLNVLAQSNYVSPDVMQSARFYLSRVIDNKFNYTVGDFIGMLPQQSTPTGQHYYQTIYNYLNGHIPRDAIEKLHHVEHNNMAEALALLLSITQSYSGLPQEVHEAASYFLKLYKYGLSHGNIMHQDIERITHLGTLIPRLPDAPQYYEILQNFFNGEMPYKLFRDTPLRVHSASMECLNHLLTVIDHSQKVPKQLKEAAHYYLEYFPAQEVVQEMMEVLPTLNPKYHDTLINFMQTSEFRHLLHESNLQFENIQPQDKILKILEYLDETTSGSPHQAVEYYEKYYQDLHIREQYHIEQITEMIPKESKYYLQLREFFSSELVLQIIQDGRIVVTNDIHSLLHQIIQSAITNPYVPIHYKEALYDLSVTVFHDRIPHEFTERIEYFIEELQATGIQNFGAIDVVAQYLRSPQFYLMFPTQRLTFSKLTFRMIEQIIQELCTLHGVHDNVRQAATVIMQELHQVYKFELSIIVKIFNAFKSMAGNVKTHNIESSLEWFLQSDEIHRIIRHAHLDINEDGFKLLGDILLIVIEDVNVSTEIRESAYHFMKIVLEPYLNRHQLNIHNLMLLLPQPSGPLTYRYFNILQHYLLQDLPSDIVSYLDLSLPEPRILDQLLQVLIRTSNIPADVRGSARYYWYELNAPQQVVDIPTISARLDKLILLLPQPRNLQESHYYKIIVSYLKSQEIYSILETVSLNLQKCDVDLLRDILMLTMHSNRTNMILNVVSKHYMKLIDTGVITDMATIHQPAVETAHIQVFDVATTPSPVIITPSPYPVHIPQIHHPTIAIPPIRPIQHPMIHPKPIQHPHITVPKRPVMPAQPMWPVIPPIPTWTQPTIRPHAEIMQVIPPTHILPTYPIRPSPSYMPIQPTPIPHIQTPRPTRPQPVYPVYPVPPTPPVQPTYPIYPVPQRHPIQPMYPNYPVTPTRPIQPSHPIYPARPTYPIQLSYPIYPVTPTRPVQPVYPIYPVRPTHPPQPAYPIYPVRPPHPPKPAYPIYPVRPTVPPQPAYPIYPMRPTHPPQPAYPIYPVRPTHPPQPTYPIYPVRPLHPAQPAYPIYPVRPTHPAQPAYPIYPMQPTYPAYPIQFMPPSGVVQPTHPLPMQPLQPVQPTMASHIVQQVQPNMYVHPTMPTNYSHHVQSVVHAHPTLPTHSVPIHPTHQVVMVPPTSGVDVGSHTIMQQPTYGTTTTTMSPYETTLTTEQIQILEIIQQQLLSMQVTTEMVGMQQTLMHYLHQQLSIKLMETAHISFKEAASELFADFIDVAMHTVDIPQDFRIAAERYFALIPKFQQQASHIMCTHLPIIDNFFHRLPKPTSEQSLIIYNAIDRYMHSDLPGVIVENTSLDMAPATLIQDLITIAREMQISTVEIEHYLQMTSSNVMLNQLYTLDKLFQLIEVPTNKDMLHYYYEVGSLMRSDAIFSILQNSSINFSGDLRTTLHQLFDIMQSTTILQTSIREAAVYFDNVMFTNDKQAELDNVLLLLNRPDNEQDLQMYNVIREFLSTSATSEIFNTINMDTHRAPLALLTNILDILTQHKATIEYTVRQAASHFLKLVSSMHQMNSIVTSYSRSITHSMSRMSSMQMSQGFSFSKLLSVLPQSFTGSEEFHTLKDFLGSSLVDQIITHNEMEQFGSNEEAMLRLILIKSVHSVLVSEQVKIAAARLMRQRYFDYSNLCNLIPEAHFPAEVNFHEAIINYLNSNEIYFNMDLHCNGDTQLEILKNLLTVLTTTENISANIRQSASYYLNHAPFYNYGELVPLLPIPTTENTKKLYSTIVNFLQSSEVNKCSLGIVISSFEGHMEELLHQILFASENCDLLDESIRVAAKYYLNVLHPVSVSVQKIVTKTIDLNEVFSHVFDFSTFTKSQYDAYDAFVRHVQGRLQELLPSFDFYGMSNNPMQFAVSFLSALHAQTVLPENIRGYVVTLEHMLPSVAMPA